MPLVFPRAPISTLQSAYGPRLFCFVKRPDFFQIDLSVDPFDCFTVFLREFGHNDLHRHPASHARRDLQGMRERITGADEAPIVRLALNPRGCEGLAYYLVGLLGIGPLMCFTI